MGRALAHLRSLACRAHRASQFRAQGLPPVVASANAAYASPTMHRGMGPGGATCLALGMLAAGVLVGGVAAALWHRGRQERSLRSLSSIMADGLAWGGPGLSASSSMAGFFKGGGGGAAGAGVGGAGSPFPGAAGGTGRRRDSVDEGEDRVGLISPAARKGELPV